MCKPKIPAAPALPPERAMERAPNRGTISPEARRQTEATFGARNIPAATMAPAARTAMVMLGGRGSSSANTSQMSTVLGG
ncbi:hypothetical protein [Microcystis phage Mel-JY33]